MSVFALPTTRQGEEVCGRDHEKRDTPPKGREPRQSHGCTRPWDHQQSGREVLFQTRWRGLDGPKVPTATVTDIHPCLAELPGVTGELAQREAVYTHGGKA
jgi:hypothetical protein